MCAGTVKAWREKGTEQRETAEPRGTYEPDPGGDRMSLLGKN